MANKSWQVGEEVWEPTLAEEALEAEGMCPMQ